MKAVIFDLDGTLIDSAPDLHIAANLVLKDEGLPAISLEQTRGFIGRGAGVLVSRMMTAVGLADDPAEHARLLAKFMTHYEGEPRNTVVYPGVMDALARLQAMGCTMGLCTNKPEAPTRIALKHFGLDRYMGAVASGDTLPQHKPDPAPLRHVMRDMGAGAALYVGDSEVDAETSRAARMPFALYTEGYRKTAPGDLPHDYAFDHWDKLPGLVQRHFAEILA
ncbi:phosphoglycolate phosphatase [Salipiger aestuarii]|uniref:Phosphoglycolate phosphatase n=1 Tax=Salipiger aestuarii TaxID=568098 RepID=A0A327YS21_9RHOB|nr:phosphoglycolate phosphatase [Salipiger aestuarii]EIE49575.1 phosphoglycolate phosphatase [Citreicella sp. 357]KAA8610155.1 phosphoglycolate phosphatase [Salipiger aestuarii]KAA8616035.1 phosphoglycolate phosphatase [Salipiger aestuarii]KAB2543354.1 phosphoglycolate phosphatase [Salipiger aestuarii]RAK23974.1 phosphoglycolate phosphatase [Salipiger aestuarii]